LEHVKAGLMRLKRAEDERALRERLAELDRNRLSYMNLWLSSKVSLEYANKALEADIKRMKDLEQQINSNLREVERLQNEIPKMQVQMAELQKRIEARKEEIKRLEKEEREKYERYQKLESEILNVQAKLREVQQG